MNNDLISIIVPVYNVEKYIARCIETIIQQSYKNIEILLIDDGSTDESGKICDDFGKKYNNISVVHQRNQGLSKTRNVGIEMAKGKYIGFVDSDDYIERDMYEILYKNMVKYDADISVCDYIEITGNMKNVKKTNTNFETIIYDNLETKIKELLTEETLNNYAWNKLYNRELFNKIRFKENIKFEDVDIMYKLFYRANKIVYTSYVGYNYVQRYDSIMKTIDNNAIENLMDATNERYFFVEKNTKNLKRYNISRRIYTIYRYHALLARKNDINNYNSIKFKNEYKFFRDNYIYAKNSNMKILIFERIFMLILLINRNCFYYILKILYNIKQMKFNTKRSDNISRRKK